MTRRFRVVCLTIALLPRGSVAQEPPRTVDGRVVLGAAGAERAVRDQTVVLHRIASDGAGPIDSARTSPSGRFRFVFRPSGENAMYIASARYAGIAYFTPPLRGETITGPDADIIVFDTTSQAIPLMSRGRHLVIAAPARDGTRRIVDVYEIANDTSLTRVAGGSGRATWSVTLPAGAREPRVGQGDVPGGAVRFEEGEARVFAPFAPGLKQLVLTYLLPGQAFPLSTGAGGVGTLEALLEETTALASAPRLARQNPVTLEGRTYQRYVAQDLPSDARLLVSVTPPRGASPLPLGGLIAATAAVLALGFVAGRRHGPAPALAGIDAGALASAVAALDAVHGGQASPTEAETAVYARRRAELKARLISALPAVEPEARRQ
jgi:hypothetical protein